MQHHTYAHSRVRRPRLPNTLHASQREFISSIALRIQVYVIESDLPVGICGLGNSSNFTNRMVQHIRMVMQPCQEDTIKLVGRH